MRSLFTGALIFATAFGFRAAGEVTNSPSPVSVPLEATVSAGPAGTVQPPQPPDLTPDLFRAVAAADAKLVGELIEGGVGVDAILPHPAPKDLLDRFRDTSVEYYLTEETGLTPLMLASAMGYADIVKLLLERGAKRNALTKRHHTFALWLAGRAGHVEVMQLLLGVEPDQDPDRTKIHISLADQTAWFWRDGKVERTMRISTGRKKFPTPKGRFVVTDKYRDWKSTIYPARMPYFLRLSCKDFGLHAGVVPGYPASHGCIRLPAEDAKALFAEVPLGTLVEIE
ncbi:MAG: L,D-transpeptidase family protein [Verrucomicrobia bacterium]|nr:L,D-transpeptidase family protein [Verrucomicrobiota bacterium]